LDFPVSSLKSFLRIPSSQFSHPSVANVHRQRQSVRVDGSELQREKEKKIPIYMSETRESGWISFDATLFRHHRLVRSRKHLLLLEIPRASRFNSSKNATNQGTSSVLKRPTGTAVRSLFIETTQFLVQKRKVAVAGVKQENEKHILKDKQRRREKFFQNRRVHARRTEIKRSWRAEFTMK
jgi:hypothetical protein